MVGLAKVACEFRPENDRTGPIKQPPREGLPVYFFMIGIDVLKQAISLVSRAF
jgi:hypothetical protein